jgi:hypothetical protein
MFERFWFNFLPFFVSLLIKAYNYKKKIKSVMCVNCLNMLFVVDIYKKCSIKIGAEFSAFFFVVF